MPKKQKSQAPKKIPTPEIFLEMFEIYRFEVKSAPFLVHDFVGKDGNEVYRQKEKCLTIEGFELYIEAEFGIGQTQQYFENREGRYSEFVSVIRPIRKIIREDQIAGGMANVYNANLTARLNALSENIETKGESPKIINVDPL